MTRMIQFTCLAAVISALGSAAWAAPKYTITNLGILPGCNSCTAYDINNAGVIVGDCDNASKAFIDRGSGMVPLGDMGGARAINEFGEIAGYYDHEAAYYNPITRTITKLGTLGGNNSQAEGMNNLGLIVGTSQVTPGSTVRHAFVYNMLYPGLGMRDLGVFPNQVDSVATDVNLNGVIVGYSGYPFEYDYRTAGPMQQVPALGSWGAALGVNKAGDIVGWAAGSGIRIHATYYDNSLNILHDISMVPGDQSSRADDINNNNWIVGYNGGSAVPQTLMLWDASGPGAPVKYDQATILPDADGWMSIEPRAINDHNQIVGEAYNAAEGGRRAVLLNPAGLARTGASTTQTPVNTPGVNLEVTAAFDNVTGQGTLMCDYSTPTGAELAAEFGPLPQDPGGALQAWEVEFTGTFADAVGLTFEYDQANIPGPEAALAVAHWNGTAWDILGGVVDPAGNTITIQTDTLSPFVLIVPEPATVSLLGLAGLVALRRRRACRRY